MRRLLTQLPAGVRRPRSWASKPKTTTSPGGPRSVTRCVRTASAAALDERPARQTSARPIDPLRAGPAPAPAGHGCPLSILSRTTQLSAGLSLTRGVRACALAWRQTRSTRWRMLVFAESETGAPSWSTGAGTYAGPGRRMQAQVDAESAADLAHSSQQRSEGRRADRRLGPRLETEAIVRMTRHFAAPASANAGCRCSRSRDRGSPAAAPPVATEPVRRGRRLMTGVSHWASPAGLGRDDSVVDRGAASQPEMETRRLVELVDAYAR